VFFVRILGGTNTILDHTIAAPNDVSVLSALYKSTCPNLHIYSARSKQRTFCFKYKNTFVLLKTVTIKLIYICSKRAKYIKAGTYLTLFTFAFGY